MDGFTGFKTAASEEIPDAVAVMDPFHVVRLAGDALDQCRRRVQHVTHGHRGREDDPLYRARRTLLTDKQRDRLTVLFATDAHVEVQATWGIYQRMISAYREPDKKRGRPDVHTSAVRPETSRQRGDPGAPEPPGSIDERAGGRSRTATVTWSPARDERARAVTRRC